jgi:hypothetical protein
MPDSRKKYSVLTQKKHKEKKRQREIEGLES